MRLPRRDLVVHRGGHHLPDAGRVVGLPEHPRQLHEGGLGQHVVEGDDAEVEQVAPRVVDVHLREAPQGLHGHHDGHPLLDGPPDRRVDRLVDVPEARAGDDHAAVAHRGQPVDDVGVEVRVVVLDRHLLVEHRRDDGRARLVAPDEVLRQVGEVAAVLVGIPGDGRHRRRADGAEGAPVARVHLAAPGAAVQQVVVVGGRAEHAQHHFTDVALGGGPHGVHQVQRRVRRRPVRRALAADEHDRHGRVLHHEAQDGAGVRHRVGAVADDDAVGALLDFLADGDGQRLVLHGPHVLAEDAEELLRRQVRDVGQFRHGPVQLARREGRDDRACPVVEPARDGSAGAEQGHVLLARVEREVLLGDLVDGLAIARLHRVHDAARGHAHVVAVEQLDHDVQVVAGLVAREDDAGEEGAFVVGHLHLAPDADLEPVQDLGGRAAVPLEPVRPFADGNAHRAISSSVPAR